VKPCTVAIVILTAALLPSPAALAQSIPSLTAVRADTAPAVDGQLDDPCWQKAAVADNFLNYLSRQKAHHKTTARLLR